MLTTRIVPDKGIVRRHILEVNYDGHEFAIIPVNAHWIMVRCKRWDGWHYYADGPYESMAEVCEDIFGNTILVERTECGRIEFDKFGNICALTPLTCYESTLCQIAY